MTGWRLRMTGWRRRMTGEKFRMTGETQVTKWEAQDDREGTG